MLLALLCLPLAGSGQDYQLQRTKKSAGMLAYPYFTKVNQPDNSTIELKGQGNGVLHWYESREGYTVLRDEEGYYRYAVKGENEKLRPSSYQVKENEPAPGDIKKNLFFSREQILEQKEAYFKDSRTKSNPFPFPATGTNNVLVILAEFPDMPSVLAPQAFDDLMNAPGFSGSGSFRDYYLDISYNTLDLQSTIVPWVQVSRNMSYYGANNEFGFDIRPEEFVREVLDSVEANGFDFSPYDNDKDGYVDEVVIMHAGYGEQFIGAGDTCIWSHAYSMNDLAVEYDGVVMDNYVICCELYGSSGSDINNIGTVVHEFAHSLAMPDLYDIDLDGSGGYALDLNFWDLMAVGSWNNGGATPAGINTWLKQYMGWMTIPIIDTTGTFTLNESFSNQEAYQLNTPVYNEYFILENRQRTGFDSYLPGHGLLIYHIDLNYPGWLEGTINIDPLHQGMDIEEADDLRDSATLAGDPFPGTAGITSFDSLSVPSSRTWDGNSSNINISNITETGGLISFEILSTTLNELPEGWQVDELSYTQQGGITGIVVIGTDTVKRGYLSAFVGDECRAVAGISHLEPTGMHFFDLIVFSNASGSETLEFRYYDPVIDSIYAIYETLQFTPGTIAGDVSAPYTFHTPVHFVKNFNMGWNWFSINIQMLDMSPNAVFTTCTGNRDYVKNQVRSSTYYPGYGWFGTLQQMNTRDLFITNLGAACGIDIWGAPVSVSESPINLVAGWNWLAFTPQVSLPIADALGSLTPAHRDYIKNQTASATYYTGYGWFGTMTSMKPGDGYMMRLTNSDQLVYPAGPSAKKSIEIPAEASLPGNFDPNVFQYNATLTATIQKDGHPAGGEGDVLTAWSGEECRGAVNAMWFEPTGSFVFPLMVYGNEAEKEPIRFTWFDAGTNTNHSCSELVDFEKNAVTGDAFDAFELNVSDELSWVDASSVTGTRLRAYPNPVREVLSVEVILESSAELHLEVYDVIGNLVRVLDSGSREAGSYRYEFSTAGAPSSVYILKINDGRSSQFKRIVHVQ